MKKVIYATLALGALILASCQKENSVNGPKVESPVFTAYIDTDAPAGQPETKTVLVETAEGKKKSEWVSGDAIRVLNGTNTKGCDAVYTTTDEGASATFTTTVKDFKGSEFIAMYPAEPAGSAWWNNEYDKTVNKLWLKDTQTAVEGGYDPTAHIAVAHTNTNSFVFQNVVALLKFRVLGTGVKTISVSGEKIAGNFSYNTKTEVVSKTGDGYSNKSMVTLSGTFTDGKDYYIAILPGTYSTLDLKVNDRAYKSKTQASTFTAGKIYDLGEIKVVEEQNKAIVMTVKKQNNWENLYIYAWDSAGNPILGAWPGKLVEGDTVTFPEEYYKADVNFILSTMIVIDEKNNIKSNDLKKTLNQTQSLTEDFAFTLPADTPGSFIVLNCPSWGTYLYIYNNDDKKITIGGWPGVELQSHDLYTYKYYPIADFIDKDFNFVLNGSGTQTKDLWTYGGDNWVKKNGCHYYTYQDSHKK